VPQGPWSRTDAIPYDSDRPRLVLRTTPGETTSADWSYWASLSFR